MSDQVTLTLLDSARARPVRLDGFDAVINHALTHSMDTITKQTETAKPFSFKEFGDALTEFFSSLKLSIFLMITLAILTTIKTVIQQDEQPKTYTKKHNKST